MSGFETSFVGLFSSVHASQTVSRIEIPIFQRDYAQGREGRRVQQIRGDFLNAIRRAVTGGEPLGLDFVYGEVRAGVFRPLDGQQRLTTLFLLHWYLAVLAKAPDSQLGWKAFSYATRPSARDFCEHLATFSFPVDQRGLAAWITDQPWYRYTWNHDPTIQSMLNMLTAIENCFAGVDPVKAWGRLTDPSTPAVTFQILAAEQLGSTEDLYIKMNSRGRPLTEFETFKARFEQIVENSVPDRGKELAGKVDGAWSNVLWEYRGADCEVDDAYQRYFAFLNDVCEWRDGRAAEGSLTARAAETFGSTNQRAREHVGFLISAFDTWVGIEVRAWFESLFTTTPAPVTAADPDRVVLHDEDNVDLFKGCCRFYGVMQGKNRRFTLQSSLLLYAALLHRLNQGSNTKERFRVLRNLLSASENEVREMQMPLLLKAVDEWMLEGRLDGALSAFNTAQVKDEIRKQRRLAAAPNLGAAVHHLEDHDLLRGRLGVFDLDSVNFAARASAFHRLFKDETRWLDVSGALLACGDYSRWKRRDVSFQLGSSRNPAPWRAIFTKSEFGDETNTRQVLEKLLDAVAADLEGDLDKCLGAVRSAWLAECERRKLFSWRYYLVKYPIMRAGNSGLYLDRPDTGGFTLCMLDKERISSKHRDPYLSAIWELAAVGEAAIPEPKFQNYEGQTRGLVLNTSDVRIVSGRGGFEVRPPHSAEHADGFERVCQQHGVLNGFLSVPQELDGELLCDKADRIQLATELVRDLVKAGL